jgi:TRAP-type C4-dicarboxylate transport system permease small subunit
MLDRSLDRLSRVFALIGVAVAALVAVLTVVSIAGRATLSKPIQGDVELTQFGIALCISLALPWCQWQRANIIVDFFTQRLGERRNAVLDGIGALLMAAMYLLLAWRSGAGAVSVREAFEATMILDLPMWWVYASLAPGLALAGLIALRQAWQLLGPGAPAPAPEAGR